MLLQRSIKKDKVENFKVRMVTKEEEQTSGYGDMWVK